MTKIETFAQQHRLRVTRDECNDDGVWVHNDEPFGPTGPELLQHDPEQSIRRTQAGSRPFPLEHPKLLAKGEHFEGGIGAAADEESTRTTVRKSEEK